MRFTSSLLTGVLFAFVCTTTSPALAGQAASPAPAPAGAVTPAKPAPLDPAALEKKIDELLTAHATVNGFSGTVLLARDGKPIFAKGFGYANVEWQIPNTTTTKFRVGSVTKQFTSMLIMLLREQGRIALDDSVCAYVTPCPEAWKPVTIHHLLTHTSGIPTYTGIRAWREVNMVPKTTDQIVAFFRDLPLEWTPGEKYAYNNSGYFLLGLVIEKITGKKYEQALQEMILTPLGMKDTGYDWTSTIIPRRASGYTGRGAQLKNAPPLDMQQPYSAGALYSTVEDLLRWDQALYTGTLLPEAARQVMWTPFKDNYAYGWNIGPPAAGAFGGHRRIAHGGGINGFSAMFVRLPDPKMTVIVLANNDSASASAVGRDVMAIYYGHKYEIPAVRTVAKVDPAIFDRYVGRYELRPGFVVTITREGNSLMAQATGQAKFELLPESETAFFANAPPLAMAFVKGADGKVTHLVLTQGGERREAKRIE